MTIENNGTPPVRAFTELRGEFGILQGEYAGLRGEFRCLPKDLAMQLFAALVRLVGRRTQR